MLRYAHRVNRTELLISWRSVGDQLECKFGPLTFGSNGSSLHGVYSYRIRDRSLWTMPTRKGREPETTFSWADQTGVGGDPTEGGTEPGAPLRSWAHQSIEKLRYGNMLWEYLVLLYAIGNLAAKGLCIIFYYIHLAGGVGDFERYGLHPDQKTDGNFQRHLNRFW